jgi:hypothetical protein
MVVSLVYTAILLRLLGTVSSGCFFVALASRFSMLRP